MPAQVIDFPSPQAYPAYPAATPPVIARPSRFPAATRAFRRYRLMDLVHMLAMEGLQRRSQISHLRILAAKEGLPLPINPRVWAGEVVKGADSICSTSEWDAAAVDAWCHRPGPVAPAKAGVPPIPAGLREDMRANALRLAHG